MANYTKKAIHGFIIVFAFLIVAALFSYLFRLLLARELTLTEYGLFYSLTAFAGVLVLVRDLGIVHAIYYFIPRFLSKKDKKNSKAIISKILKIEFITSLLVMLLIIVFSDYLVQNYFHSGTTSLVIIFAIGFFFNSIEMNFQSFFNAFQNQLLFSIHNLSRNIIVFLIAALAFKYFSGITIPLIAYLITYIILLILFASIFFKLTFPDFFDIKTHNFDTKKLILFGIPAALSAAGFVLIAYTDTLMLTYFRNMEEVGLYNGVVPIISLMLYVPFAISAVILPMTSELWQKKKITTIKFALERITKYLFIFLIPTAGVLLIFPEITLNILFGQKFIAASSALVILAVGAIFYGIGNINSQFLLAIHGPKVNTYISLSLAAINIILCLLLIPSYGIIGAAISTSLSYILLFILTSTILYNKIKMRINYIDLAITFICGLAFIALINYLKNYFNLPIILETILVVGISGLIYLILLFVFRIISIDEFESVKKELFKK
ncbi:MAG: flippase [Candidatus Woesearchaeota archaeon]